MKAIKTALIALFSALALTVAADNADMKEMAPYVYPQNSLPSVSRPAYAQDGQTYLALSSDGRKVVRYDIRTGKETETVMDADNTRESKISRIESFTLSPDGTKLLLVTGSQYIYRRSTQATHYIYEIRTRILRPLSENHAVQRAPLFSPDGRMVAFVALDNNIYLKKLDYNTEVPVTTDGKRDAIINGVPDWVYEEEFTTASSLAWAPDNLTLCYLKYDETDVPLYSFPLYQGTCDPKNQYALYPGSFTYKYPVAGEPNSKVSIWSYDIETRKNKAITLKDSRIEYIPRIAYGPTPDRLMAVTLNREQNRMEIYSVNPRSATSKSVLVEQDEAWIKPETYEQITFNPDGFVLLSARTGYTHAYLYAYNGSLLRTITSGKFDVTAYYGSDPRGCHYYQSTATGAINRTVDRIDPKGVVKHLSPTSGNASAWLTPGGNYYTIIYSNATTSPAYNLYASAGDKKLRTLLDTREKAAKYASAPKREFITVPTADGLNMNGYIIKPADFNPAQRYPVIMYQYSGPGSQEVLDRWSIDWMQYAAMRGYIVLCVDGRGTGGRGRKWETAVYKNLGHYETLDQQAAAHWIASQSYVDPSRIGLTGWSYGGYETLMAISTPSQPFASAVAIAPVTDWRYYDSIYTERYMLTPQMNPDGYAAGSPVNRAGNVTIPLLLMHGTADDNVHLVNTLQFVSVMQQQGRFCDMFLYPNMNHSINGCNARLNVYSKMLHHFDRTLKSSR